MKERLMKDWSVLVHPWRGFPVLIGRIYNDDRFEDGSEITTTEIISTDFENKTIQTKNTLYNLE